MVRACLFLLISPVDAGRLRAALRLELYQIISGMVMWSSGDARARHHPRHRPADGSGAVPCPAKAAGRYRRVSASWLPWLTAWASVVEALRLRGVLLQSSARDKATVSLGHSQAATSNSELTKAAWATMSFPPIPFTCPFLHRQSFITNQGAPCRPEP